MYALCMVFPGAQYLTRRRMLPVLPWSCMKETTSIAAMVSLKEFVTLQFIFTTTNIGIDTPYGLLQVSIYHLPLHAMAL